MLMIEHENPNIYTSVELKLTMKGKTYEEKQDEEPSNQCSKFKNPINPQ